MARGRAALGLALAAGLGAGCASSRPVLYPNAKLESVGRETAEIDVSACMRQAEQQGLERNRAGETAGSTAAGAGVGAAVGAAAGAVTGRPGRGAAAGAAGGGAGGFFRGLFRTREPDPVFKRYVELCLRERGYQTIGWK